MTTTITDTGEQRPTADFQIRVRGHLGAAMLRAFPGLQAQVQGHDTVLGGIADQAALHGALARVEDLGLELLEVRRISLSAVTAVGPRSGAGCWLCAARTGLPRSRRRCRPDGTATGC